MIVEQPAPQPRPETSSLDRRRVAIIAAVVALAVLIGVVLGGVLIARGSGSLTGAADYVPEDVVTYMEADLSLPGAQRDNLRAILARFPGVNADDLLSEALADTLDNALALGGAPVQYSTDVAPWFDGTLAVAMLDYPVSIDPGQMEAPATVVFFGTRDATAATTFTDTLRGELEDRGASFTSTTHHGTTIWVLDDDPFEALAMTGTSLAYAVTDDQVMLATGQAPMERALDARSGGSSLADRSDVAGLLASLPDERVGVSVVNGQAMVAEMLAALEATKPQMAEAMAPFMEAAPGISVGSLGFAADAVLLDGASELHDGSFAPENSSRDLATSVPGDAIFYADAGNVGASLEAGVGAMKAALAAMPGGDEPLAQIQDIEAALGADLEEFVSWIGAGAATGGWDGEEMYIGAVLDATDPTAAARRLGQLESLAGLASGEAGSGISVTTETVSGVEVVTLRFTDATAHDAPFAPALQWAIDGNRVIIGLGDRFVGEALTLDPSASMAQNQRYTGAVDRLGGTPNAGTFILDLAGLQETVLEIGGVSDEPMADEVRPYLEPFDYLAGVNRVEGDHASSRLGLVFH